MNGTAIPLHYFPRSFSERIISSLKEKFEQKPDLDTKPLDTKSSDSTLFAHDVLRFHETFGRARHAMRSAIIEKISLTEEPDKYINTVIRTLIASPIPGRLDDAIDIIHQLESVLERFVSQAFGKIGREEGGENYWYILIRALGKSSLPSARTIINSRYSYSPEAAVEALGDIGDESSLDRLREITESEEPPFIKELAGECLKESLEK